MQGVAAKNDASRDPGGSFRDDDCFILEIEGAFPGKLQPGPR